MKAFNEKLIMHRCLELARKGAGMVSPNPLVGCVIVRNDKIVGEGYHKKYTGAAAGRDRAVSLQGMDRRPETCP